MKPEPLLYPGECEFYPGQRGYYLHSDFSFVSFGGGAHTIPAGFWFNGASIPAAFWQVTFSPFDPLIMPHALAHDWAYCSHIVPRDVADRTLQAGLQAAGAPIRAGMVWGAVAAFGGMFWADDDQDKAYMDSVRAMIRRRKKSLAIYGL